MAEPLDPPPLIQAAWFGFVRAIRALGTGRYRLADAVGMAFYVCQPARRRRTAANQGRADPAAPAAEVRRRARASFREYARTAADFVWANGMQPHEVRRHSEVLGMEHVRPTLAAGRGGILVLSHAGNWDMAANIALANGFALTTVMAPLGPGQVTRLIAWARVRNQLQVFTPDRAARGLVRALRGGRFVALLSDVSQGGPTVAVPYRGGLVPFSTVPAWLHLRTGAPLFPVVCCRERGGYVVRAYPAIVSAAGDDERAVMRRVAAALEDGVRRHPEQWYPFGRVYADEVRPGDV